MPFYESDGFEPPAPVARALVRRPNLLVYRDLPLLIDTDADGSVIPRFVADAVGAGIRPFDITVRFYDGTEMRSEVAEVEVEFLRYRFRGPFLVEDAAYGILGRNIVNLMVVTLDGPSLTWSAQTAARRSGIQPPLAEHAMDDAFDVYVIQAFGSATLRTECLELSKLVCPL